MPSAIGAMCRASVPPINKAGAANVLGTSLAPPKSDATIDFAVAFYTHWLQGRAISQAVLEARRHLHATHGLEDLTWARYVLFGDPFTTLPRPNARTA